MTWTTWPLMSSPRIASACSRASSTEVASLTPPALPRPPVLTWALTTTAEAPAPRWSSAAWAISSTVRQTVPGGGTGTALRPNSCLPWNSTRSIGTPRGSGGWGGGGAGAGGRLSDTPGVRSHRSDPGGHVGRDPVRDLTHRGPRGEDRGDPLLAQGRDVDVGDDAPAEDDHVLGP